MWSKLGSKRLKWIIPAGAMLIIYIGYQFSFSLAFEAFNLNKKLKAEAVSGQEDVAYPQLNKKYLFYKKVLSAYKMQKEIAEDKTWQVMSGMAVNNNVNINYTPSEFQTDTAAASKISHQKFQLKGSFFNLLKLLDTLGRTERLGGISSLSITKPKDAVRTSDMLLMEIELRSLEQ